jgi:hypothetical protein
MAGSNTLPVSVIRYAGQRTISGSFSNFNRIAMSGSFTGRQFRIEPIFKGGFRILVRQQPRLLLVEKIQ